MAAATLVAAVMCYFASAAAQGPAPGDNDASVVEVPTCELPFSDLASDKARALFEQVRTAAADMFAIPEGATIAQTRKMMDRTIFAPQIAAVRRRYAIILREDDIANIRVQIFDPVTGISPENADRVLINLHGERGRCSCVPRIAQDLRPRKHSAASIDNVPSDHLRELTRIAGQLSRPWNPFQRRKTKAQGDNGDERHRRIGLGRTEW